MEEKDKLIPQQLPQSVESDEIEVIELDNRFDMTIDPLAAVTLASAVPNTYCHNKGCCAG